MTEAQRIYIDQLASQIDRAPHTIRQWLALNDFPEHLRPQEEGGRRKMFWTRDQIKDLKSYAAARKARIGKQGRDAVGTAP